MLCLGPGRKFRHSYFFEPVSPEVGVETVGPALMEPGAVAVLQGEVVLLLSAGFLVGGLGLAVGATFFGGSTGDERGIVEKALISCRRSESNPDIPGMPERGRVLDLEFLLSQESEFMASTLLSKLELFSATLPACREGDGSLKLVDFLTPKRALFPLPDVGSMTFTRVVLYSEDPAGAFADTGMTTSKSETGHGDSVEAFESNLLP